MFTTDEWPPWRPEIQSRLGPVTTCEQVQTGGWAGGQTGNSFKTWSSGPEHV